MDRGPFSKSRKHSRSKSASTKWFVDLKDNPADPDPTFGPDLPRLEDVLGDTITALTAKEMKRQLVLNELLHTERSHVRQLMILDLLFHQPMVAKRICPIRLTRTLFPNLDEVIHLHSQLNMKLQRRRLETPVIRRIADIFLWMFDGENGQKFRQECAKYCRNQFQIKDILKELRTQHAPSKFLLEAESYTLCQHRKLEEFLAVEFQRLTKYPLLIHSLKDCTRDACEKRLLEKVHLKSKEVLAYVDQAVHTCENDYRLSCIQRQINTHHPAYEELKELDVNQHKLVLDGVLSMKLQPMCSVEMLVVLLEDVMLLLQTQDDTMALCPFTKILATGTKGKYRPILKLENVLARGYASDNTIFFVINDEDDGAAMYTFVVPTQSERDRWVKDISDCATKARERKGMSAPGQLPSRIGSVAAAMVPHHEVHTSDPAVGDVGKVFTSTDMAPAKDQKTSLLEETNECKTDDELTLEVDTVMGGNHDDNESSSLFLIKAAQEINSQLMQLVINSNSNQAPMASPSSTPQTPHSIEGRPTNCICNMTEQVREMTARMTTSLSQLQVVAQRQQQENTCLRREIHRLHCLGASDCSVTVSTASSLDTVEFSLDSTEDDTDQNEEVHACSKGVTDSRSVTEFRVLQGRHEKNDLTYQTRTLTDTSDIEVSSEGAQEHLGRFYLGVRL
ncbi:rho guanine nucleotide exchange factor 1-like isoform X2 [Haliotis rubra]|uniref:rho guanine nucleotide exchange factor 1-like isoform X2 n=1 Tax=Haliotis rubra TaxID=36100 RepID=UPI001EE55DCF|nr:rho guanine nucleotide exchange factor 1-like isoform X2 [Haliotis rubra]